MKRIVIPVMALISLAASTSLSAHADEPVSKDSLPNNSHVGQPDSWTHHPILNLFSRHEEKSMISGEDPVQEKSSDIFLQIWTGTGGIAQQKLFSFSDRTTIARNRNDPDWWFSWKTGQSAAFAIWQASRLPFPETIDNWAHPEGLISSDHVITQYGLGNRKLFNIAIGQLIGGADSSESPPNEIVYIRIIALDQEGKPVGNPSNTVEAHFVPSDK
ncbi:MAG: hypothetical protein OQK61_04350 [Ignavibacteriaceae bacterium]|nr:hypothetical protein [Ignavibacteriaceae bacterium]